MPGGQRFVSVSQVASNRRYTGEGLMHWLSRMWLRDEQRVPEEPSENDQVPEGTEGLSTCHS